MTVPDHGSPEIDAMWREMLTHGHRNRMAILPGGPRCTICRVHVGGVGGAILKPFGYGPSRKNPSFCNVCENQLPCGGAEIDIAVLFADIRGSTGIGERLGPSEFARVLNRFYRTASENILAHNGMIDKMIGDEVMALFIPFSGPDYRRAPVHVAEGIMRDVGYGGAMDPWLPLGIGIHAGTAYVGKVGTVGVNDFTAIGDTVNVAARLQAEAKAGDIVLSETVYEGVNDRYPELEQMTISVRGKDDAVSIRTIPPGMLKP